MIDPGPDMPQHIETIVNSLTNETIVSILVTHNHRDHSPGSRLLKDICNAPIYGMRYTPMSVSGAEQVEVEEEIDEQFVPDEQLSDGKVLATDQWHIECVHTPGHMPNHFCFRLLEENALFTGDHIMGWSTTVIIPPYGSMADYVTNLKMLQEGKDAIYYPTHGPPIVEPKPFLDALIRHRKEREDEIVDCLRAGMTTVQEMVSVNYADVDLTLHKAASLSLLSTVAKLVEEGRVECFGSPTIDSHYRLKA